MINYHIVEQKEHSLVVEIVFPETHPFFNGHFDTVKILPAVAQLVTVEHVARATWGEMLGFRQLKQTKFKAPIFPDMPLTLFINFSDIDGVKTLIFQFQSENDLKSSGRLLYGE